MATLILNSNEEINTMIENDKISLESLDIIVQKNEENVDVLKSPFVNLEG
jgi:hypothetical protein